MLLITLSCSSALSSTSLAVRVLLGGLQLTLSPGISLPFCKEILAFLSQAHFVVEIAV